MPTYSTPVWFGNQITCVAGAAVTGGRFVKVSADLTSGKPTVIHCSTGNDVFGVAAFDAAQGDDLTVWHSKNLVNQVLVGTGDATAGQLMMSDTDGKAIPYVANTSIVVAGRSLTATAAGAVGLIDMSAGAI